MWVVLGGLTVVCCAGLISWVFVNAGALAGFWAVIFWSGFLLYLSVPKKDAAFVEEDR